MALHCGIIGLPNVGKSTLFNALTSANIEASNFPFCTIEPNTGVVLVPDPRLATLEQLVKPQQTIPANVEFVDIAGLVKGASKGEGLGNAFLANIRETQALVQVVRCFSGDDIIHVNNQIDPLADVSTVNTELALADLETLNNQVVKRQRLANSGNAEAKHELAILKEAIFVLDQGKLLRSLKCDKEQQALLDSLFLLTAKPMLYLANVDETAAIDGNQYTLKLAEHANNEGAKMLTMCNAIEAEIALLDVQSQQEFITELGLQEAALGKLIRAGYKLLQLNTYFTAGKKEVRAWTYKNGASALEAAGIIHTDFMRGFIRAEVISYEDYLHSGGEQGAKEAGKWRLEGKQYMVQDGDVIYFRTNT